MPPAATEVLTVAGLTVNQTIPLPGLLSGEPDTPTNVEVTNGNTDDKFITIRVRCPAHP